MRTTRRTVTSAGVAAALLLAGAVTAEAVMSDRVGTGTTIVTATITPPTNVSLTTTCDGQWAYMRLNWTASTAPRITGYRITLQRPWYPAMVVTTGPTATTVTLQDEKSRVDGLGTVTITTLTGTSWSGTAAAVEVHCP